MAGIRISGMASGLPPNIVEQIMEGERIPVKTMEVAKAKEDEKLKLVNDLETRVNDVKKNLDELVGTRGFTDFKLSSGDPNIIDGVADPAVAVTGDYQVEVLQLAQKPGAVSVGFPDKDKTQLGLGYLKFQTNSGEKQVFIDGKVNTLDSVAAKINNANVGVRAQVLNDRKDKENPYKLLITGLATGDDQQVEFPKIYLLDGDQDMYFESSRPAQNARVKIDGFEIELSENNSKDVIPGVTLDLKQAAPGRQVQVKVKENTEVISGKIKSFVDAYNKALSFIQDQHKLTKGADGKEKMGPLGGDSLLRQLESSLRSTITSPQYGVDSSVSRIIELGVEFSRNGTLSLSTDKFNAALNKDPKGVANFLRGDGTTVGFVPAVKRQIRNVLDNAFGPIPNRKRGLQQKIDQVNKRIENKERLLVRREEQLREKFSNLESKMSQLNSQGSQVGALGKQAQ